MAEAPSFTFYTYSPDLQPVELRWRDDGVGDTFFGSADKARAAVEELRQAVAEDQGYDCPPMRLERVGTVPVTSEVMLALLNGGVGAIVKTYDIIETIGLD